MILSSWLKKRKQKAEKELYNRGFDYAMGVIIRGEKTPLVLDAEQWREVPRNLFDVGMDNAIDYAVQHGLVKDDRMW